MSVLNFFKSTKCFLNCGLSVLLYLKPKQGTYNITGCTLFCFLKIKTNNLFPGVLGKIENIK